MIVLKARQSPSSEALNKDTCGTVGLRGLGFRVYGGFRATYHLLHGQS